MKAQEIRTAWAKVMLAKYSVQPMLILSFRVDGLEEILSWVLGWSGWAKVIKPEKLREMVVEKLRAGIEMNVG